MKEILDAIIAQITQETRRLIDTKTKTHENKPELVDPSHNHGKTIPKGSQRTRQTIER